VHAELGRLGVSCGRKRVARLMRQHHLVGAHARRRWRRGKADTVAAPDLEKRDFNPPGPDRLWAADVTQIRTAEGWLHLAAVVDLWSRTVAGWAMGPTVNAELVGDALVMAFERHRPDGRVIHHSDRGAVYTSFAFSQRILDLDLDQSFGAVGSCYDNAAVRSSPPSDENSLGSTKRKPGQHAQRCEQRSSTTSRRSTTPYASNNVSATAAP
jgi:transposase InsO family protein